MGAILVLLLENIAAILLVVTLSLAGCASAISNNLSLVNDLVRSTEDVGTAAGFVTAVGNRWACWRRSRPAKCLQAPAASAGHWGNPANLRISSGGARRPQAGR